jgi:hypothetical protein
MKLLEVAGPEQALPDERSDGAIRNGSIHRALLQKRWASKR